MLITAVHGLGELAVGGSAAADVYRPPRDGSGGGLRQVAEKSRRLVSNDAGGVHEEKISAEAGKAPVLSEAEIAHLVQFGLEAENLLGGPLDIEWAVDINGVVVLLQARPLKVASRTASVGTGPASRKALLTGGLIAAPGRGVGLVRLVGTSKDLEELTEPPYVFVMHQSLVEAVGALRQVGALLVDLGNPADHLSCVAREYEIPMLTGLGSATTELKNGEAVVVDCNRGMVFQATADELAAFRKMHKKKVAEWKERVALPENPVSAALYNRIVPLNLTDAYGPTFTIAECKTIHDLVRYAHEKAVMAMFAAGDEAVEKSSGVIAHLDSEVPFHFSIIDLGGGLLEGSGRRVKAEQVSSRPFRALWQGVLTPGLAWGPAAGGVAIGSVMSRFMADHRSARPIGLPNYALLTRDFLNINARMDFHFTMVDTICGNDARLNYIKFRFKGGGTSLVQRCRRVSCLAEILAASGFFCDLRDDLLTASIQGGGGRILEEKLKVVGRILGFSRLLDAAMHSDELVPKVAQAFLEGDYKLESLAAGLSGEGLPAA
jgi:pyruvate,water dikinase